MNINLDIESKSWAEPDIAWLHRFDYLTVDACHIQGQGVALGACYYKAYQAVCPRDLEACSYELEMTCIYSKAY